MTTTEATPKSFPPPPPAGPRPNPAPEAAIERVLLPTGTQAWLVTRHDDVRQLLRSPDFSADFTAPGFPVLRRVPPPDPKRSAGLFIRMDAPDHTFFRRMLTSEFMIKNMRTLEPLIRQTVVGALDSLTAAGQPADLVEHFALPVPSMVICHLLGVPYADHAFFQNRSRTLLAWSTPPEEAQAAADDLRAYLERLIDVKVAEPGDDLVSRLATERLATGEITRDELVGLSLLLLIAGHETTANMIGLSALVLLQHPEQLRELRDDPALIDDTVEELLRYLTIVRQGLPRVAVRDTVVGDHEIKAGEGVIALLSAANFDAEVFAAAEEFDLHRGSHSHVAFGFGVHQCLGQPLARSELRIALAELTQRLPDLALAVDPSEVEYRDAVIYGVRRLPVTW
ncbi:cytochrome P450 [Hamadaea tsunoensis]|uniref:cytochrome P450 n=1 Tax=Hamadaea tsunoensis TaxID=53368 RepID=UPI0003FE2A5A|nr:cytochrome P450 [Hamadaea tsunoensis]